MKKRAGRPKKGSDMAKAEMLEVRVGPAEKQTFKDAADLAGIGLSTWVRERLRRIARRELEEAGRRIAFLEATETAKGAS
jgi:uncharacterized protein (DUF1778 family)